MPFTLQSFLAETTPKAMMQLVEAFLRVPEDKRNWSPEDKARPALDLVAECAILNGYTANLIQTRTWPRSSFDDYFREKSEEAAKGWEHLHTLLQENTRRVVAVISQVPDADLAVEVDMPWGKQTLAEIISYPYWNMTYHLGQINYVASMLGCLE